MATDRCNILVSAAGRRVALVEIFRQALVTLGVTGRVLATDVTRLAAAWQAADDAFLVPPCGHPDFTPTMVGLCRNQQVDLVVPTIDPELDVYARNQDRYRAEGTHVAVSSPEVVRLSTDKVATHDWLIHNGFPTVRQATVPEAQARPELWPFPVLVKPRSGSSAIGVGVVGDAASLEVATRGGEFLVQSIARGNEFTVDVFVDRQGRCRCQVPRQRLEVRAGEVSKAVTVRHPDLEAMVSDLVHALPGPAGALNVQVLVAEDATMSIIEVNPRFGGGFPLTSRAGASFASWLIEEAVGRPCSATADGWTSGLVMLRYDDAVFTSATNAGC